MPDRSDDIDNQSRPVGKAKWLFLPSFFMLALLAGLVIVHHYLQAQRTVNAEDVILQVPQGSSSAVIAKHIAAAGLYPHQPVLKVMMRVYAYDDRLQWGEYCIEPNTTLIDMLETFQSGDRVQRSLSLPEGLSSDDILDIVNSSPLLVGAAASLADGAMVLPETYFFEWGTTRQALLDRMVNSHATLLTKIWRSRPDDSVLTSAHEAVILASVIEKETGMNDERGLVASVFHNRLRRNMRLQSDPTVIFAITGGGALGRPLLRADLRLESPYNTYRVKGLPPTPIAHPGRAALEAAVHPALTDYLYFVADGYGGHNFAETLTDHNDNVRLYRAQQTKKK